MGSPGDRAEIVTAVLRRHGRILLCHRTPQRERYPNLWSFPGGHVESGESAEEALVRELAEELGIEVAQPSNRPAAVIEADAFRMQVWLIESWTGTPTITEPDEHDDLIWADLAQARDLDLAHPEHLYPLLADLTANLGHPEAEESPVDMCGSVHLRHQVQASTEGTR